MLALVCPGQGAQAPGMLAPWLELPGLAERLDTFSRAAGTDLAVHGTASDAETIRDTAVAQPLIVAASLLSHEALLAALADAGEDPQGAVAVTAGHSVGEFAAAVVAGALTAPRSLELVGVRGAAMARAAQAAATGMSAVVGGDPDEVAAALARHDLVAANANGGGQVVAAGLLEDLAALAADPPGRARVVPLAVAGAFHTAYMEPARADLRAAAERTPSTDPGIVLLSNADGTAVARGGDVLERLVAQVAQPVRWDLCQDALRDLGVTGLVELAPGGVLTGLARRTLAGVETVAVKSPADLDAAVDLVRRHRAPGAPGTKEPQA